MILLLKLQHTTEFGIPVLTSPRNPLLKDVRRAAERGTLTSDGFCIAETFHLVEEALRSPSRVALVIASESAAAWAEALPVDVVHVSDTLFHSIAATETSQGVMALVEPRRHELSEVLGGEALAVVLDGIQDPGNAGTIVRAAEAFGATGAILLKGSVNPYNPKAVRASAGSLFRLPVVTGVEAQTAAAELLARGVVLYAAMPGAGQVPAEADFRRPCAIAIGSEGRGVGAELRDAAVGVRIPTKAVESLNAAIAAGVLLYEAQRQRSA